MFGRMNFATAGPRFGFSVCSTTVYSQVDRRAKWTYVYSRGHSLRSTVRPTVSGVGRWKRALVYNPEQCGAVHGENAHQSGYGRGRYHPI
ncbi:hypothetical protein ZHAS_00009998 [Anopheles sinensis]|uniref:Uncharacterized protein n=1 Tax=Anopheles sinensis TaxID=74873 RepID=A0A084VWG8_ANOSI|nr:hypothetical protein ZHAS_00009998 [Anopheles sinensis]